MQTNANKYPLALVSTEKSDHTENALTTKQKVRSTNGFLHCHLNIKGNTGNIFFKFETPQNTQNCTIM